MKKQLCSVLILVFLFPCLPAFAKTVKIGFFQLKPHAFIESGSIKPMGASIDYFNILAKKMGYKVSWKGPIPFQRLIKELKNGSLDGAIIFLKTPERKKFLYFSNTPIFASTSVLAVKKNNPLNKIKSVDDVNGYTIGFLKGGRTSPFVKNNTDKLHMELIPGETWVEQNLLKLNAGRLDAVYDLNEYTLKYVMHNIKLQNNFKFLKIPEKPNPVYPVFSKASSKGKELHQKCNKVVKTYTHDYSNFMNNLINKQ